MLYASGLLLTVLPASCHSQHNLIFITGVYCHSVSRCVQAVQCLGVATDKANAHVLVHVDDLEAV